MAKVKKDSSNLRVKMASWRNYEKIFLHVIICESQGEKKNFSVPVLNSTMIFTGTLTLSEIR